MINFKKPLNFIDGEFCSSSSHESFDKFSPSTGQKLCTVPLATSEDINRAVACAKNIFPDWSKTPAAARGRILWKAAQILRANVDELAQVESLDCGKPINEARFDITCAAEVLEYYGGLAPSLHGQHIDLGQSFAYTRREALGVCAGIGAWNFPLVIACWKIGPALASGNTMVFKPSEFTPLGLAYLAEALANSGLPAGVFNILQGDRRVGEELIRHKDIAKVSLTGSVPTGKKILSSVADKVIPVTLELGGKSPLIIFDDCNLQEAVRGAMLANFVCQGEICSNGTRVFIQENLYDKFVSELLTQVKLIRVGNPLDTSTTMGALISQAHKEKVLRYIETAKREGATLLYGGDCPQLDAPFHTGNYINPTIFTDCTDEMTHVKEEIFGPVMSILKFKNEDSVIARANNTDYGLGASVFTQDLQKAHRVVAQLQAGICWINNHNPSPVEIPFGGFKQSGLGRENGLAVLEHYTQIKTVYVEMGKLPKYP